MFTQKLLSIILLFILGMLLLLSCKTKSVSSEADISPIVPEATPKKVKNNEPLTIAAVGDIMLGSPFPNETRMPPNDGADLLKEVTPFLEKADIAFGNLEGPMTDGGISEKCGTGRPNCFAFRMPTRYGK